MKAHYARVVRDTEKRVAHALSKQNLDKNSPYYGAYVMPNGVYMQKHVLYQLASLSAAYCCKDTKYYHDERILESMLIAFDYVDSTQHENGLFDYITCNFFSAPDTAFCIGIILPMYRYLRKQKNLFDGEKIVMARMEKIIHAGGRGLLEGGFHTPNHRWAIAGLLCQCGKLFGEQDLTDAAFQYLKEGIDCNDDGEYSEKSAGNYNGVNNEAMLLLADALGDDSYEQHVIRNLRMMLTYWEPDESIFTANSTRFDKDRLVYPVQYYFFYLYIGAKYNIPEFLAMANYAFNIVFEKQLLSPDLLGRFMLYPHLADLECDLCDTPKEYKAYYEESGIARVRHGRYSYTVMKDKSNFLYVHNGSVKLAVKIGGSFCEHRAFKAEKMWMEDGAFHLQQTMRGWYYLPFPEKPDTSDWWKMDNASRPKKWGPDMDIHVVIRDTEEGIDLQIQTSGVKGAPWRVEFAFSGIDRMETEHMIMPIGGDEIIVIKDGFFTASNSEDSMQVGPCFGNHHFTEGKEDSEAKTAGCATVYLTDYTEFNHTISIRP